MELQYTRIRKEKGRVVNAQCCSSFLSFELEGLLLSSSSSSSSSSSLVLALLVCLAHVLHHLRKSM